MKKTINREETILCKKVNKSIKITTSLEIYLHSQKERFGKPERCGYISFVFLLLQGGVSLWEIGQKWKKNI